MTAGRLTAIILAGGEGTRLVRQTTLLIGMRWKDLGDPGRVRTTRASAAGTPVPAPVAVAAT